VLIDKNKLINKYISTHFGQCLKDTIVRFEDFTCLLNICGFIDGTHIPLAKLANKKNNL
jgi:hypothetical protein